VLYIWISFKNLDGMLRNNLVYRAVEAGVREETKENGRW
jgi:hypothetical protein